MNPRELRIGNIIKIKDSEIIVSGINERGISPRGIDFIDARNFEGVPLTEEWLTKFSFRLFCGSYEKEDVKIFDLADGGFILEDRSGASIGKPFRYVHQLQNLYFEITGEELTIQK